MSDSMPLPTPPILVDQQYLNEILRPLGYPLITLADNDLELTEDEIKSLCILPTLREYYKWFPIKETVEYTIAGEYSIDFPDLLVFGATDARLIKLPRGGGTTSNPFVNERFFRYSREGSYGTRYDYDLTSARITEKNELQSMYNYGSAFNVKVDQHNRKVIGYTTITGQLSVEWARWSSDFGDIPFQRIDEAIKLSQSYLLESIGMIRGQMNQGTDVDFNYQMLVDKANDLRDEVKTSWKGRTKPVVLRG